MSEHVGLKRGTVILKKYHEKWARAFEEEKTNLKKLFDDAVIDVQHIGSTAIPNISAKPIVDMLMAVRSLSEVPKMRSALEDAGYTFRENGSDDIQILFVKGPGERRTHHLHITELGSPEWRNSIAFRDYLRAHPDEAARYEELKKELAARYANEREMYTAVKQEYIEEVPKKATDALVNAALDRGA